MRPTAFFLAFCLFVTVGCSHENDEVPGDPPEADVAAAADVAEISPEIAAVEPNSSEPLAERLSPTDIVAAYFELLKEGRGPEAVRRYWDSRRLSQRLYGEDLDALSAEDRAEVAREHERFLMGIDEPNCQSHLQEDGHDTVGIRQGNDQGTSRLERHD